MKDKQPAVVIRVFRQVSVGEREIFQKVVVGYYGVDFIARPLELKLLQRAHLLPAPQRA